MDPIASKLAFSAAAAGAALLGAMFPHPSYEAVEPARPWAQPGAVNAWQPASGQMLAQASAGYSYSGALPSDRGPIDVYGAHGWRLAREREILERQEAELHRAVAQAVVVEEPAETLGVEVHRGGKPAEAEPLEPAESAAPLAEVSDQ
ncbi:hypothetical protein [Novosphingobium sp.]|uniref:hypothetical protein n=1 Tax=Novosphingobium sp. TaxID=1874826 RepID=UPI00286E3393|nr:hypothetical protein [Novosphingobium sp.]